MAPQCDEELYWFAAKLVTNRQYINGVVSRDNVRTFTVPIVSNLFFIRCTRTYLGKFVEECAGMLYFYRDPERRVPQAIDNRQMDNFILVASVDNENLISLGEVTHNFLQGQRVRVKGGVFQGAEGVIKRVKGDRRLIVSISGVAAVATSYIHPSLLELVGESNS